MLEQAVEINETPRTVIMAPGRAPSAEPTIAQRDSVARMIPKITQYVGDNLTNGPLLEKYRLERATYMPEAKMITPELAKQIIKSIGIELGDDAAYLQAYHLLSVTENLSALWSEKPPSQAEQAKRIQQNADTLAENFYDSGQDADLNVKGLDNVLKVLTNYK